MCLLADSLFAAPVFTLPPMVHPTLAQLIASFKRVRKLTDDHSVLVESARASEVVVFDEANGKIKRKHPLPVNPRELLYFTAVLENLAADATVEAVTTLCTQAGFEPNKVVIVTNSNTKDDVTGWWDVLAARRAGL